MLINVTGSLQNTVQWYLLGIDKVVIVLIHI